MRKLLFLIGFILSLFSCQEKSKVVHEKKENNEETKTIKMLRDFYTVYVNETCEGNYNFKKVDSLFKACTVHDFCRQLEKEQAEKDYDMIINGHYCEKEWLNNMIISKDTTSKDIYIVTFEYLNKSDSTMENKGIQFKIREKEDTILIDKLIKNTYTKIDIKTGKIIDSW